MTRRCSSPSGVYPSMRWRLRFVCNPASFYCSTILRLPMADGEAASRANCTKECSAPGTRPWRADRTPGPHARRVHWLRHARVPREDGGYTSRCALGMRTSAATAGAWGVWSTALTVENAARNRVQQRGGASRSRFFVTVTTSRQVLGHTEAALHPMTVGADHGGYALFRVRGNGQSPWNVGGRRGPGPDRCDNGGDEIADEPGLISPGPMQVSCGVTVGRPGVVAERSGRAGSSRHIRRWAAQGVRQGQQRAVHGPALCGPGGGSRRRG